MGKQVVVSEELWRTLMEEKAKTGQSLGDILDEKCGVKKSAKPRA